MIPAFLLHLSMAFIYTRNLPASLLLAVMGAGFHNIAFSPDPLVASGKIIYHSYGETKEIEI